MSEKEKMLENGEEGDKKDKNSLAHIMSQDEWEEFVEDLVDVENTQGHEQDLEALKELRRTIAEEDKRNDEEEGEQDKT